LRRRFFRKRINGRHADKAGVGDHIEQNFHPDRHRKKPSVGKIPEGDGWFRVILDP
jgi:hypothetical protein